MRLTLAQNKVFKYAIALSNILLFTMTATGQVTVTPSSINFNNVPVGQSAGQSAVLSNPSSSYVTVSQATTLGAGISITMPTLPVTLAPLQSLTFTVTFQPQSAGNVNGSISFVYSASNSAGHGHLKHEGSLSTTMTIPVSGSATSLGQLVPNPNNLSFSSMQIGTSQMKSLVLTNSGGASVTISQTTVTGSGFSLGAVNLPLTVGAGQAATLYVTFAPISAGTVNGNLAIASDGSNPSLNITLSGTGVTPALLNPNPSSINFGSLQTGSTLAKSETLTNTGGSSLTITQAAMSGTGFTLNGLTVPQSLAPGQSVTFSIIFAPTVSGSANGTLALVSNAANPNLTIAFSGSATSAGQLIPSPTSFDFGSVLLGTTSTKTGSLTANGNSVTISSASFSSPAFTLSGLSFPLALTAGQSASFAVTFTPQTSGTASGNLTFTSNASNSTVTELLAGSGAAPVQHNVNLSWSASTSVVAGYNVYRGTQSGGPYVKLNPALDASTSYTDSSVQSGQNYFYVATAVTATGIESIYSNEVGIAIPTP